jgi:hypothetical protein
MDFAPGPEEKIGNLYSDYQLVIKYFRFSWKNRVTIWGVWV